MLFRSRLGREQVLRLVPLQDHRPERATATCIADAQMRPGRTPSRAPGTPAANLHAVRPVWLLQQAEPLPEREVMGQKSEPLLDGQPLQLLSGPERIESGWWDGDLVERDYFIAQLPGGALVWIYCSRVPVAATAPCWFLQGRFG